MSLTYDLMLSTTKRKMQICLFEGNEQNTFEENRPCRFGAVILGIRKSRAGIAYHPINGC